jgi:hypothetical protein
MKGYRTYQILLLSIVLFAFMLVQLLSGWAGFGLEELETFFNKGALVCAAVASFYTAFMAVWKVIKPYPMKHESK